MAYVEMTDLEGLVFTSVAQDDDDRDTLRFESDSGDVFVMYHAQDCCEVVYLDDVIGDLEDLVNTPILEARVAASGDRADAELDVLDGEAYVMHKLSTFGDQKSKPVNDSETWTFYLFRTIKGSVTLRWFGSSNGYYSESVNIYKV